MSNRLDQFLAIGFRRKEAGRVYTGSTGEEIMKWQPIETAPKDGTVIDIWNDLQGWPRPECRVMGYWWDGELPENYNPDDYFTRINVGPGWWSCSWGYIEKPTHWMPLPDPPKLEKKS